MSKEFYIARGATTTWPALPPGSPPPGSIAYNDVLLVPGADTKIESRKKPDLSVQFGPYVLRTPVISAPMDTISGEEMILKLNKLGAMGSLPRNKNFEENLRLCERFSGENIPCLYAIGLKDAVDEAGQLKERGAKMVLVDVAHGGMEVVKKLAGEIKNKHGLYVVAGNIVTYDQAEAYKQAGIDAARVGVGPGAVCTTRIVSGHGFPQMSAVFETTDSGLFVIADGGIVYPGDVAKAMAAGAKLVMIGSLFGGTEETPGEVMNGQKALRGQASESYMTDNGTRSGEYRAAEGIDTRVPVQGSVSHIIDTITGGMRSALSYTGAENIEEFQNKAVFNFVSSAAQKESRAHILEK